ncbi:MAG: amidohydrolase family protein, partial [Planctomycetota bacterium]
QMHNEEKGWYGHIYVLWGHIMRQREHHVTPGLINAYSRLGLDSRAGSEFKPSADVKREIYPTESDYDEAVELGITTLGLYPPGSSVAGQALAIRPDMNTLDEMIQAEGCYLKIGLRANSSSKKALIKGFGKVSDYDKKNEKALAKWKKDQEKKKKKSKSKSKKKAAEPPSAFMLADDDDDKKENDGYTAVIPDNDARPFLELRAKELKALITISRAAGFKHFLDAKGEEEFEWAIRCPITRELDLFYVKDEIGEMGVQVVFEPTISLHPGTMRQRNLPAEFAEAGARLVLIPRRDNIASYEGWRVDVGRLVSSGLDRETALRAMTLEPAALLGMEEEVGSLKAGKRADMVFYDGDPLEVGTKVEAVMIDGQFVFGGGEL